MLQRLYVRDFTVFAEADFEFGPGLNVVVGTNGTGKSHVLKLGYAVLSSSIISLRKLRNDAVHIAQEHISGNFEFIQLEEKLKRIFRPAPYEIDELLRRNSEMKQAVIRYELKTEPLLSGNVNFGFHESDGSSFENLTSFQLIQLEQTVELPVLIPAKEILTLGWMTQAARQLKLPLDEAYLDLLLQLSGLPLQNPEPAAAAALQQLATILGGEVEEDNGRFYLVFPKEKRLEMNMVAEGLRKFGTLQKLLANGSLTPKATLFWDEPEANLNPALLRKLAAVLAELARQGFQIIMATHSLFLLKELHILSRQKDAKKLPMRYFGLNAGPEGATTITTVDDFEKLPDIVALDAELEQADTLTLVFAQDDADHHGEER